MLQIFRKPFILSFFAICFLGALPLSAMDGTNEKDNGNLNLKSGESSRNIAGQDKFNFLSKKYPDLLKQAGEPFKLSDEEKQHYQASHYPSLLTTY